MIIVWLCNGINIFIILFYLFKCLTFNLRFLHLYNHYPTTLTAIILFFPKNLNDGKWKRNAHTRSIKVNFKTDWVFYSLYMYIIMLTALDFDYHHMAS